MKKLGIIFGGMSTENEISVLSAISIIKNLDKNKYKIYPIYITKNGGWYECKEDFETIKPEDKIKKLARIENIEKYLKRLDVVFPILHGLYGEDGTIQGMLEIFGVPYVGCRVLASSIGMDKVYSKAVFEKAKIKQAKYVYIKYTENKYIYITDSFEEEIYSLGEVASKIAKILEFPVFVKPSNSGSSIGVNKANNVKELVENIRFAQKYDNKILIEQGIIGKEVECAVLGNDDVIASCVGEIKPVKEFYTFDAKYKTKENETLIPAEIDEEVSEKIKMLAIKAFKAIDGAGFSRVDFFVEKDTNEIYINEINTIPGFTTISMYLKLFNASGIGFTELMDRLIELAVEKK